MAKQEVVIVCKHVKVYQLGAFEMFPRAEGSTVLDLRFEDFSDLRIFHKDLPFWKKLWILFGRG